MLNVRCPKCTTLLKAPDSAAGKLVKCVKCGPQFTFSPVPPPASPRRSFGSRQTMVIAVIAACGLIAAVLTAAVVWTGSSQSGPGQAIAAEQPGQRPVQRDSDPPTARSSDPDRSARSDATAPHPPAPSSAAPNEDLAQRRSRLVREHDAAVVEYNALPQPPSDLELQHEEDMLRIEIEMDEGKIRSETVQKTSDLVLKNNLSSDEYESRKRQIEQDAETTIFNRKMERRKKYRVKLDGIVANEKKKAELALKIETLRTELATIDKQLGGQKP